ncbi:multidrug transporter subunit MdtJ [Sinorhizobium medicae]|uniref:Spermidine export protein MdtJ n=2 Tax=Sinorhizobium medicae TaxID=110321 RepID=A0A508WWN5_9HYPH|nr:multidrug transporter subunit MdtJ [Sinorhizobium medicae]ABR60208.1 small multidrug resistance protein [Sinorhizobium medicae WSM419]MBO1962280.1 multidrug transporter subunit MdtJ [Sinorhizobium medicae]MDX0408719.1 multidrug transporter subunit MdtJ [Sinorhizobium medicae]MDX0413931.1 multidrug transporter subunit MdtJ [Sinorhizobium medicae]MDX0420654.1 multidrug transporter subunit MdtJ [Sinorhizobium medicae]
MRLAWFFLVLAIVTEVVGLTVMKAASGSGTYWGHIIMYASIALSYVFLARAVKVIPVGVAYAVWEGSGVAVITLVSVFAFGRALSGREMLGLAMAVAGILLVNAGKGKGEETDA